MSKEPGKEPGKGLARSEVRWLVDLRGLEPCGSVTAAQTGGAKPSRVPTWSASGRGAWYFETASRRWWRLGGCRGWHHLDPSRGGLWRSTVESSLQVLEMPSNSTSLCASGEDAVARVDGGDGSGGGAGGTIIINVSAVNGSANIQAAGGRGGGCIGGGGGGGAIGSAAVNASEVWASYSGKLDVNGGLGDSSLACRGFTGERGCMGELLQLNVGAQKTPSHGRRCVLLAVRASTAPNAPRAPTIRRRRP